MKLRKRKKAWANARASWEKIIRVGGGTPPRGYHAPDMGPTKGSLQRGLRVSLKRTKEANRREAPERAKRRVIQIQSRLRAAWKAGDAAAVVRLNAALEGAYSLLQAAEKAQATRRRHARRRRREAAA